jgi:hypothetical protein
LLKLIISCWQETDVTAESRQTGTVTIDASAAELLRVALNIDHIAQEAIEMSIQCIQNRQINGKYCIPELRIALLNRNSSENLGNKELLLEAIGNTQKTAELCISPFFVLSRQTLNVKEASDCLELLPIVMNILSTLRKKMKRSRKCITEVLDSIFGNQWHPIGFLTISSTICELFPHLRIDHLQDFKVI